jgi:hypothetical protein
MSQATSSDTARTGEVSKESEVRQDATDKLVTASSTNDNNDRTGIESGQRQGPQSQGGGLTTQDSNAVPGTHHQQDRDQHQDEAHMADHHLHHRETHKNANTDCGRHGDDWLFGGYQIRDAWNWVFPPSK